jgi:hypothetical protein
LHYNKTAWRKLYKEHDMKELAEMVMEDEIEARLSDKKALFIEDTEWSALIMQNIILSTDRILLESILVGDLTKGRRANPKLEAVLNSLQAQSQAQPGIYQSATLPSDYSRPATSRILRNSCNCLWDAALHHRRTLETDASSSRMQHHIIEGYTKYARPSPRYNIENTVKKAQLSLGYGITFVKNPRNGCE